VAGELLLDTSGLVGLLDRSQTVHTACLEFFTTWSGAVVTTEAVLTESTHLLSGIKTGPMTVLDFILRGTVMVPTNDKALRRCRFLMDKYSDTPMDYADATLVVLAEDLNTDLVFTCDRDFRIYRIHGRKPFKIFPTHRKA
jgi:predicted nucleic acid-binding protein